ncbi:hypothetical protein CPB83DRAFT_853207 [Crepidotus variabilis]|uniref:Ancillary SecYEG translocon subunit/Cell division coordinator CpoB TPR domain-containing protein n=1 Tax=Crepidotus variabilis TaxID=179855 RepID=A0A9P6EI44_9AGAR|nr:hypothetical protein CPB83DRAFT_853207 [Crepidotus variabilis]
MRSTSQLRGRLLLKLPPAKEHSLKYLAMLWPWTSSHQVSNVENWRILSEDERQSRVIQLLDTIAKDNSRTLSSGIMDQLDGLMELYDNDDTHRSERLGILEKAVEGRRIHPGIHHQHLTDSMLRLVCSFMEQTEWAKAEGTAFEVIQWCRRSSNGSTKEILTKIHLCDIYIYQERWPEAEHVLRWMLKKTVGELVESMANEKLARALLGQGRHDEAGTIVEKLIASTEKSKEFYWIFLHALCLQGEILLEQGESDEASQTFQAMMIRLVEQGLVKDRWGRIAPLVSAIHQLAMAFIRTNKRREGFELLKELLEKETNSIRSSTSFRALKLPHGLAPPDFRL